LGFGLSCLPLKSTNSRIDESETAKMLYCAVDHGINYIDLGYPYETGQYEHLARMISRILREGYREKVRISSTLPVSRIKSSKDFEIYLHYQLAWLESESLDFILFGGLNRYTWPKVMEHNLLSHAEKAIADGLIFSLGFSFHDDLQLLMIILDSFDKWTFVQFQYSFMDAKHHPGIAGLRHAADKGLAVVIEKPLKGGRLIREIPESVAELWNKGIPNRSPAEWALRWVWNHPEVSVLIGDMNSLEDVKANASLADQAMPNCLTIEDELLFNRIREAYNSKKVIPCTGCYSCMPCPRDIDVPRIFEIYNDAVMYNDNSAAKTLYAMENHCIDECNNCGSCIKTCGRSIAIPDRLKEAYNCINRDT
jgi:predicted aldo/keto reductase-like oxidoreductase